MAVRIATADGNFTAAATWGVVDATALLDSETANTALTTAYVESSGFTPGVITVDGVAVKIASRAAVASGTISVRIAQGGALVAGTEVTINVSDLSSRDGEQGWYFFKFAAPVSLAAATVYTLSAKTSVVAQVNLYRDGTAGNWSRLLRTTTTGAPAGGDSLHVLGEWTAAATKTDRVVTMDSTGSTDYGSASTTIPTFTIGQGGTLTWGTTAATAYVLRVSGILAVYHGGILNMGTAGTPVPRGGSAQLEFDCAADGDFGLKVWGTWSAQGQSRTAAKNIVRCLLNTDEAAGQTALGVDTDTGWLSGDEIAIASTSQTASQAETRVLNGNAAAASITVTVALTNAHSGTSPTQAEVILLSRNVRVRSVSTTAMAYVYCGPAASIDADWVEFRYLGHTTTGKRGIEIDTNANGSLSLSYCSIRNFDNHGVYVNAADADNFTIEHLTGYLVGNQVALHAGVNVEVTTGTNWTLANIDIISGNTAAAGAGVRLESYGGNVSNLRCNSGSGYGVLVECSATAPEVIPGSKTWSGFNCHANSTGGLALEGLSFGRISNVTLWRNQSALGANEGGLVIRTFVAAVIDTGSFFGNGLNNVGFSTGNAHRDLTLRSVTMGGDSTFATAEGLDLGPVPVARIALENCDTSASGIRVVHSTADIQINSLVRVTEISLVNTVLAAATEIANSANLKGRSVIRYQRVDQATATHKTVFPVLGTRTFETTVFRSASPSEKLEPASLAKLESGPRLVPVASGGAITISAYVRKSALYTGSAPRLMCRANPALGIDSDTVVDSLSVAADTWEQLTGVLPAAEEDGVLEFYVDCDGSAGAVYIDDWSAAS